MPDVAGTVVTGHVRSRPCGLLGEELSHSQDGDRVPGADVVRRPRLGGTTEHSVDGEHIGASHVVDVYEVAHLPTVLEHLRSLTGLQRGAEDGRHSGVGGVAGHPRTVDVVVPQAECTGACLSCPREGVVLLGDLAGRVAAPRVESRVFGDELPRECPPAVRAVVLEVTLVQC